LIIIKNNLIKTFARIVQLKIHSVKGGLR